MSSGSSRETPRRTQAGLFDKTGEGRITETVVDQNKMAEFGSGSILMSLELANATAPETGVRAIEEHERFTGAVRERDPALATKIVSEHLEPITHDV